MVTTSVQVNIPKEENNALLNESGANMLKYNAQNFPESDGYGFRADEPTIGAALGTGDFDRNAALNTLNQAKTQLLSIQDQLNNLNANKNQGLSIGEYSPYPTYDEIYGSPVDENRVRRDTLKMFQGQIDATNQVYDQLLAEAKLQGEGRLGSQRAIAARGGILGSDFAGAQKEKVQQYNTDIQRGIGAERAAAIGAILGQARQSAQAEIANKRAARQQGAENYLNYLAGSSERRQNNINGIAAALFSQNIDPVDAEDEINAVAQEAGVTPDDIKQAYYQLVAANRQEAGDQFTLSAGERRYDAQGNLIAEVPESAGGGKIYSTGSGLVRINADGTPELIFASSGGSGSSTKGSFSSGSLTVPASQVSEMSKYLEESRVDGYVPAAAYQEVVNQLVQGGAVLEDIANRFPPKDYLNPSDSNVPPHLASKLKSASLLEQFGLSATPVEAPAEEEEDSSGWFKSLLGL